MAAQLFGNYGMDRLRLLDCMLFGVASIFLHLVRGEIRFSHVYLQQLWLNLENSWERMWQGRGKAVVEQGQR